MRSKVSFVVVEYNSIDEIDSFSDSLSLDSDIDVEIIISSNSQYNKPDQIRLQENFSKMTWIFNPINGGFAYAMNRGLKIAKGDFLVIVNPDVRLIGGFKEMILFFKSNDQVGAIAPQIVNDEGILQDSFRNYISINRFIMRCIKRLITGKDSVLEQNYNSNKIQTVDWVIGAFIMIKREVYQLVGGLDENYFLYCEDMDWCTAIRSKGYEIVYYPKSTINYQGTRSARKSFKYQKIFIKSLFRYWKKFGFTKQCKRINIHFEDNI